MPGFIEQLGQQTASQGANSILGIALGAYNDHRQLKQQEKLQALQMQGNKEMTDYQMMKQLEMWKATGYKAQVQQMKEAGINPALLYGMGGGGGQSTGSASGNVTGGSAPVGGREIQDMQGMGIQYQLAQAQTKLIEAQTEKTKGEAANLPATGENIKADTENKLTQNFIMEIERDIKGATSNAAKAIIIQEMRTSYEQMEIAVKENKMTQQQLDAQLGLMKAQAAKIYIDNELTRAQTTLSGTENEKKKQEIEAIKAEIRQLTDPQGVENYFEREKLRLMEKGINVAIISATLGTILNFAKPAGKGITINK